MRGAIAAGHPQTAEAGAEVLRSGGNAVDAAIAAVLASFVTEPMLTGLGAGGFMMVAGPGSHPVLLDFFVAAPGKGYDPAGHAPLEPVVISFGDAVQTFNVGAASVGVYGNPAGLWEAASRWATLPFTELAAPAAALARQGVAINLQQAYIHEILAPINATTEEAKALLWPLGRPPLEGEVVRDPALADALELLATEGPAPFYTGEIARTACELVAERGGSLTPEDLATYKPVEREPVRVSYRGREMDTNPPPSSGGILIAYALGLLERGGHPPSDVELAAAERRAQTERDEDFIHGLTQPGFVERFMASRLGSTTHIATMDDTGWACSVTCTNGASSGQVVPGTGIHLNNMMGEADLNPLGFFGHEPGRRLPSMMAPTMVLGAHGPELALGSAGSARIRSAILQVIINVLDRGMDAEQAVRAPRLHYASDGLVYCEPGVDVDALEAAGHSVSRFRDLNLFFGGAQAVVRDPATGAFSGAGDPRRGGVAVTV
jgi:gamma-glutamyltranspeptidase/glutathione hydrolase